MDRPSGIAAANLQLSTSGVISGSPKPAGMFTFTVQVADSGSPQQIAMQQVSLSIAAGSPTGITATSGSGQSTQVGSPFSNPLSATLTDTNGNPVQNVAVTFTAPPAGASGTFAGGGASATVQTNAVGVAISPAFTANAKAGSYTINAAIGTVGPATFSLTNTAGAASTITSSAGSGQSAQINHTFASPLVAAVQDANGNPVQGANVTFVAPVSGASGIFGTGGTSVTIQTNASGIATSPQFSASGTAGTYNISATTGALAPALFNLTNTSGPPGSIIVTSGSGQSAQVKSAFGNPLVATVEDANQNPVANASVIFTAPLSGPSGTFAGGGATATVQTNASGVATSPVFAASTTAGNYVVVATVAGAATPASFSLTNSSAAPASVTVSSGSGQSAQVRSAFGNPLVVRVKDAYGNPTVNAAVTFSAPGSGASGTFAGGGLTSSVGTNPSGVAISPAFTANGIAGSYLVTAGRWLGCPNNI